MSHNPSGSGQASSVISVGRKAASTPMPPLASSGRKRGCASEPDALHGGLATKKGPDLAPKRSHSSTSRAEESQLEADSSAQRLREDLDRAHTERLPGARILLVRPPVTVEKDRIFAPQLHPALYVSETRDGRSIMGVLQRIKDIDFTFMVPFLLTDPSRFCSHPIVDELRCTIFFNPVSDDCEFMCVSHTVIVIGETSNMSFILKKGHIQSMEPGMWKIAIPTNGGKTHPRPLVDFLLLKRKFEVAMEQPKAAEGVPPSDSNTKGVSVMRISSSKAVCEDTVTEFLMEALTKRELEAKSMSDDKPSPPNPGFSKLATVAQAAASDNREQLAEIRDGQTATIVTAPLTGVETVGIGTRRKQADDDSYQVTQLERIDKNQNSSVFSCLHSKIPNTTLVAKILNVRPRGIASISSIAHTWRHEMQMLQKLNHPNIVMMKAFDARFFAIYLEHLPGSLSTHSTQQRYFSHHDAARILRDVASALAYLDTKSISHNDIKPSNIAYSPERGAVVLDFGLATNGPTTAAGGTAWYVAPEAADLGVRDGPSNVWSLGVTMLYVLGRIDEPEVYGRPWNFGKMQDPNSDDREAMENWLEEVYYARDGLDVEDPVQGLVYDMLERDPRFRVTADAIEETLRSAREENSGV